MVQMVKKQIVNEDVLHDGYGKIRKRGILSKWSEKWLVLQRDNEAQSLLLNIYNNRQEYKMRQIPTCLILDDVIEVKCNVKSDKLTLIGLKFQSGVTRRFAFTYLESRKWYTNLKRHCLSDGDHLNKSEINEGHRCDDDDNDDDDDDEVFQENVSQDSTLDYRQETFEVYVKGSPRIPICGQCYLTVDGESIHVYQPQKETDIYQTVTWPLVLLRRYGYDSSRFVIDAGRECATGEGVFTFKTVEGEHIQDVVQYNTDLMANQPIDKQARSRSLLVRGRGSQTNSHRHRTASQSKSCCSESYAY